MADIDERETIDAEAASLKARYAAGDLTEDRVEAEIRRLALARAALGNPAPAVPPATDPIPLGRFVSALGAFCDAYLTYDEARRA